MKNLIGISGRIGHGKDTVAQILNLMLSHSMISDSHIVMLLESGYYTPCDFAIMKFAGKLKETASLLTGIPVQQFEDQEFKKSYLPSQWDYWSVSVIDNGRYDYESGRFATKEEAEQHAELLRHRVGTFRLEYVIGQRQMTVRQLLQELGTEAMRMGLHPDVWVNALFSDYNPTRKWIISDTRFDNEFKAIKARGGVVIRVNRPGIMESLHPSEVALENHTFDFTIENDGDLESLVKKVREIAEQLKS